MNPIHILGLDPGSTRAGYGVIRFSGSTPTFVDGGILDVSASDQHDRLVDLYNSCNKIIATHHPDAVGIEKLYFSKNTKTAMEVSHARGVLLLCARQHNLPVYEFSPSEIKQGVTGSGSADKKSVELLVKKILHTPSLQALDDVFDALGVALVTGYALAHPVKNLHLSQ